MQCTSQRVIAGVSHCPSVKTGDLVIVHVGVGKKRGCENPVNGDDCARIHSDGFQVRSVFSKILADSCHKARMVAEHCQCVSDISADPTPMASHIVHQKANA